MCSVDDFECKPSGSGFSKSPLGKALSKIGSGTSIIIGALINLGEEEKLIVSSTAKAVLTTAATSLTGSLLAGGPGLLVGMAVGTVMAYKKARNSQTLKQVLESLTPEQKEQLSNELMNALKSTDIKNLTADKLASLMNRQDIKDLVIKILVNFLMHKFGMKLNRF